MLEWFNAATARASRSNRSLHSPFETFSVTMRSRRVSLALYTSPIPPAPMGAGISYGPSRVPAVKAIGCSTILPCGSVKALDSSWITHNPEVSLLVRASVAVTWQFRKLPGGESYERRARPRGWENLHSHRRERTGSTPKAARAGIQVASSITTVNKTAAAE